LILFEWYARDICIEREKLTSTGVEQQLSQLPYLTSKLRSSERMERNHTKKVAKLWIATIAHLSV
jgi:hypothetical protein